MDAAFFEGFLEGVAADGVCFVDISFYCVCRVCEASVEGPVVYWVEGVCGEAGCEFYAVDGGGFFEAGFCAAVNCCVEVVAESLGCFNDASFDAAEVQVWRLRVEDSQA